MTKNLILGPILTHLAQMLAPNFFLKEGGGGRGKCLPLLVIWHCSKVLSNAI